MIKRYCEGYIGSESGLPIVRLKPIGPLHVCPFLKKRKCEINVVKPFVCAFFPLGRVYRYNENTPLEKHSLEPKYIYTNPQCGDDADTYTVLEWMEKNNIPVKDDFGDMWSWVVFRCAGLMRDAESSLPDVLVYQIRSFLCSMMYFNYSINEDFMTQFYSNFEKIKKFVKEYFSI